ncbi:hypothetical protein E8E11_005220 [Didymella keratinophila]|nr:hypothetical protein E8E11_005220 [Didymella keratinophila]
MHTNNLLRFIATASSPDDNWDNTGYQFIGRSFGDGAAVGLMDPGISGTQYVQQYTYNETGLVAETTCIYNESSALGFSHYETPPERIFQSVYMAYGALPNSNWSQIMHYQNYSQGHYVFGTDFYAQSAFVTKETIVSTFSRMPIDSDIRWMFGMTAGVQYRETNKTLCETIFSPSLFKVDVSVVDATIRSRESETSKLRIPTR